MSSSRVKKDVRAYQKSNPGVSYTAARRMITGDPTQSDFNPSAYKYIWDKNESTSDLIVPLGWRVSSGKLLPSTSMLNLNLASVTHGGTGPHGVIAGREGSGKSALIRNIVTSLCATNSPTKVGIRVEEFNRRGHDLPEFPHIINSGKSDFGVDEDRTSVLHEWIKSELSRRNSLLEEYGAKDIHEYRALSLEDSGMEPLPFLILILSGYPEHAKEQRRYAELISAVVPSGIILGVHQIIVTNTFDLATLGDFKRHMTYGVSFSATTPASSKWLTGEESSYNLPCGKGHAEVKYLREESGDWAVDRTIVFSEEALSRELEGTLFDEAGKPTKRPAQDGGDSSRLMIGSNVSVPANESVAFVGERGSGRTTAMLSMIAASAEKHERGHKSRWVIIDFDRSLRTAVAFPNVSDVLDGEEIEDEDKVRALVRSIRQERSSYPTYIAINSDEWGDRRDFISSLKKLEEIPNVYFVLECKDLSFAAGMGVSSYKKLECSPSRNGEPSKAGFVYDPQSRLWNRISRYDLMRESPRTSDRTAPILPRTTLSREALSGNLDGLVLGVEPFSSKAVCIPKSVDHLSIVGEKSAGTLDALRAYIRSVTENYTPDQAMFVVSDFDIEMTDIVKNLIDQGYMEESDYAVNYDEWKDLDDFVKRTIGGRIPSRSSVLKGQGSNGKWYEGREVFLIVGSTDGITQDRMSRWTSTLNTYDVGVHLARVASTSYRDMPNSTAHIMMWGGEFGKDTSVSFQTPLKKIDGRAYLAIPEGKEWGWKSLQVLP